MSWNQHFWLKNDDEKWSIIFCFEISALRLLRNRQRCSSHEGRGWWRGFDRWRPFVLGIFDQVWKEFHCPGKLRKPNCFWIFGYWMAIVEDFPQGNAQKNSSKRVGRILSQRFKALITGFFKKTNYYVISNCLWLFFSRSFKRKNRSYLRAIVMLFKKKSSFFLFGS